VPATTGGLFGRDTHEAADISQHLLNKTWPLPENIVFGDQTTPLLHFLAAIVHRITNLGLYPTESTSPIIPRILPVLFIGISLLLIYFLFSLEAKGKKPIGLMIPIVLWFPLLEFYTTFRRSSLSLLLLVILTFTIYKGLLSRRNLRAVPLFLVISGAILLSHRAGTYYALFLLMSMTAAHFLPFSNIRRAISRQLGPQLLLFSVFFISFLYVTRDALAGFVMLPVLVLRKLATLEQPIIVANSTSASSRGFFELLPTYALFGIVMIIAVTYFAQIMVEWRNEIVSTTTIGVFFYSGVLGGLAVYAYFFPTPIEHSRILTVFVLSAAWLPLAKLLKYSPKGQSSAHIVVSVLLILTVVSTLPMFVLSGGFTHQIDDGQRFEQDDYAVTAFIVSHSTGQQIIGDANLVEVVSPRTDRRVIGAPRAIVNASAPKNSLVVLGERNMNEYLTTYRRSWVSIKSSDVMNRYQLKHSKIYAAGGYHVWVNGTK
jgi:hypothetical protein